MSVETDIIRGALEALTSETRFSGLGKVALDALDRLVAESTDSKKPVVESDLEWGPDEGVMTWPEAVAFAKAKGDGWRLPTVAEIVSMFDYDKGEPKDAGFKPDWYWTSSALSGNTTYAWSVDFAYGNGDNNVVGNTNRVRCVRCAGEERP